MAELMPQSSCWRHGGHRIKVLAVGFRPALIDGQARRRATSSWAMAGLARSWFLDALLHLSYESLPAFSDRGAWGLFPRLHPKEVEARPVGVRWRDVQE